MNRSSVGLAALLCFCAGASGLVAETITGARFSLPTSRYAHGILGDAEEWGQLEIDVNGAGGRLGSNHAVLRNTTYLFRLPLDHVFEDVAPRMVDVTGDGAPEVIVVETDVHQGAALAVYTSEGKLTETLHIGQRNRWLAPIGAADLDGDGPIEIAYIDRPHLAKTLRVVRYKDRKLIEVATLQGVTNHRVGERDIAGGIRLCGGKPEIIVADGEWKRVLAVTLVDGGLVTTDIGPHVGRASFARAMKCE